MNTRRLFGSIMVIVLAAIAEQSPAQEEMRFVDNTVFEKPARGSVAFEHDSHNETSGIEECNTCHHVYENGKFIDYDSSEDQYCSDCHDLHASGKMVSLRNAFHRNCKGCHLKRRAGPIMCGECHFREVSQ